MLNSLNICNLCALIVKCSAFYLPIKYLLEHTATEYNYQFRLNHRDIIKKLILNNLMLSIHTMALEMKIEYLKTNYQVIRLSKASAISKPSHLYQNTDSKEQRFLYVC